MNPQWLTACTTLWQDTGGQSLYRASLCISQSNCIHPKSCIWEAIPNFTSEMAFSKHTFRHLLFGHESTYLVAVLLYDQENACHEHKCLRDAKFRMIFQEKLQKIDHSLSQPSNCCLVSKQNCSLGMRGAALTHYPGICDICAGQIYWPKGSCSPSLLKYWHILLFSPFS